METSARFELALEEAATARDNGYEEWPALIYRAMQTEMLTAADADSLEPLIRQAFASWKLGEEWETRVASVLRQSPVLADRASVAMYMGGDQLQPALLAAAPDSGHEWFRVYDDASLLDADWIPWISWTDFVDAIDTTEGIPFIAYLTAFTPAGEAVKRELGQLLANRGYTIH